MKITVEIDCTTEEARAFLGLPDVTPVQEAFVEALQQRMSETIASMDDGDMMKAWMPGGMAGMEKWADMWKTGAGAGGDPKKK